MKSERRYDLDWLRVGAFSLLILYHTGMLFVSWDWHIKDPARSHNLEYGMIFINQWRLPLLFVISGIGVSFALGKRSLLDFLRERSARLLIPLVAGILLVIPPQVYLERFVDGTFQGSFFEFYPHFFSGLYPEGNFSWHHLWFIVYLYVYCLLALPLFWLLSQKIEFRTWLQQWLSHPFLLGLMFLPVAITEVLLRNDWPSANNLFADWANLISYFLLFLTGFLISTHGSTWSSIVRFRRMSLLAGLFLFIVMMVGFRLRFESLNSGELVVYRLIRAANSWAWILTLFGYAKFYLNKKSSLIESANRAVYPFYILHQTVIIILGFLLLELKMPVAIKFPLIAVFTFLITFMIYRYVIQPNPRLGFLFGLKRENK